MLDDREKALVSAAISFLGKWKDRECCCGQDECSIDNPQCSDMEELAALRCLDQLETPPVKTRHPERLINPAERIYFEAAKKLGEKHSALNGSFSSFEHILNPDLRSTPPVLSTSEVEIAATLIQWLGTTCGKCFMDECERKITAEKEQRREWHIGPLDWDWFPTKSDWCDEQARLALNHLLPETDKHFEALAKKLSSQFRRLMVLLAVEFGFLAKQDAADALFQGNMDSFRKFTDKAKEAAKVVTEQCLVKPAQAAAMREAD